MKKYYAKQRGMGILLLILAILVSMIDDGNITALLIVMVPSVYMIFTKEKIIYDDVENKEEES